MTRSAALLVVLAIGLLMAIDSADYFFRHPLYETGDAAADSLSVERAKHFAQLYGAYSRWGFHHPGPAFFYVQALGEWIFFDVLGIVPAPFNGQALLCLFVEVGFFVAALQVFLRWLPARCRWWFLAMALALAALHFGNPAQARAAAALRAGLAFQSMWTAHVFVPGFLCLLAASALVAAGRGEELPLLVLAGGCLVHAHVAQPMFVLPCSLVAYAGLVRWYAGRPGSKETPPASGRKKFLATVSAPWQHQRRAHLVAGVLLAAFGLPLIVDFAWGSQSNFAAILQHVHTHQGQHKPFLRSLLYFLQFGAYQSYQPGALEFHHYDAAGLGRYLRANLHIYLAWTVAFGLAAWAVASPFRARAKGRPHDEADRFLAWAGAFLFLAVILTLRWGVVQDGEMFYYNAWFNFSIYFFAALIAAGIVVRWALTYVQKWVGDHSGRVERGVSLLASVVCMVVFVTQLRIVDDSWSSRLAMHERLQEVIASPAARGMVKFLDFQEQTWPGAAAVALQLARAGERPVVSARWATMFGAEYVRRGNFDELAGTAFQKWSVIRSADEDPNKNNIRSRVVMADSFDLTVDSPALVDLNNGGTVSVDCRAGSPGPCLEWEGWTGPQPWGTWINGKRAVLVFRSAPVKGEVKLVLDVFPFLEPAHGLAAQRLRVACNGARVGPEFRLDQPEPPPLFLIIPEAIWNRVATHAVPNAVLEFALPDAIASWQLDRSRSGDPRALSLGVRRIVLSAVGGQPTSGAPAAAFQSNAPAPPPASVGTSGGDDH